MAQFSESILKVVAYFDMFNYPITMEEIRHFLDQPVRDRELESAIKHLLDKQMIWQLGRFYSLRNDPLLEQRRLEGNMLAVKQLKLAMRISRFISWFPYVRGVGISGSLSKNFAYKGSDFDFFIITAADRLWIARCFLHVFVKLFYIAGLGRLCCLNYYIDQQELEIREKNIFTATEGVTLLPAHGKQAFQNFFSANQWLYEYLPNSCFRKTPKKEISSWVVKRGVEWILNNKVGNSIDSWLLKLFTRRWNRFFAKNKITPTGFRLGGLLTDKHFCKPIPNHYQQKILNGLQERVAEVKARYTVMMGSTPTAS